MNGGPRRQKRRRPRDAMARRPTLAQRSVIRSRALGPNATISPSTCFPPRRTSS
ncbi:MAG: hypothetical protein OJF60_001147 [Burkholderiaceae bacterium]|nr:MAG: hypothetical protein OJF60_001147 [Burkholderiaceae bacterium]